RSPTYIVARPSRDKLARWLQARLPAKTADALVRWKNVLLGMYFFSLARRKPERVRRKLQELVSAQLEPGYDVDRHFSPSYNPWDQRVCLVPDGDLFAAMNAGRVSVVTDRIERFTPAGLALDSGAALDADII